MEAMIAATLVSGVGILAVGSIPVLKGMEEAVQSEPALYVAVGGMLIMCSMFVTVCIGMLRGQRIRDEAARKLEISRWEVIKEMGDACHGHSDKREDLLMSHTREVQDGLIKVVIDCRATMIANETSYKALEATVRESIEEMRNLRRHKN